jgi:hypothetical protein
MIFNRPTIFQVLVLVNLDLRVICVTSLANLDRTAEIAVKFAIVSGAIRYRATRYPVNVNARKDGMVTI